MGGADPLTSKVAVVRKSARDGVDVDYLFLQVFVDRAIVSDAQNCGNILAGVGPFALERGLVKARCDTTKVTIFMENTQKIAVATVATPGGVVTYVGDARIDGVPGFAAPVPLAFRDTAGSTCGALLPSGNAVDLVDGTRVCLANSAGTIFAVCDVCTHAGMSLAEGELHGTQLLCIWHGARFDLPSGDVVSGPADEPVETFEVRESDGGIWVRRRSVA